jgi:toxin-antitoxin system PIN domain toxin
VRIVDVNVLLYALNEDAAHHAPLLAWWTEALNGDVSIGLPWSVVTGFLRIVTNPRVLPRPLQPDDAIQVVDDWLACPNVSLAREKEGHWETLRALVAETGTAGNLTTDAHLAALAMTYDATLVSCDNDFGRFKSLRWQNPLAG